MNDEDKKLVQEVIDRILYSTEDYKERLKNLNNNYNTNKKVKHITDMSTFRFGLDKAI